MKTFLRLLSLIIVLGGLTVSASSAQASSTRIYFGKGTTSTTVQGYANASQTVDYVIGAAQGQTMQVAVFLVDNQVPPPNVYIAISDAQGKSLVAASAYQTSWSGTLSATQDYKIQVVNLGAATNFRLEVSIPRDIRFARGGTSAILTGNVTLTRANQYLFSARANQWITLTIVSPNDNVRLTLAGDDGIPLLRSAVMPSNTWSGTLPASQRYHLMVEQLTGSPNGATYTLTISIIN